MLTSVKTVEVQSKKRVFGKRLTDRRNCYVIYTMQPVLKNRPVNTGSLKLKLTDVIRTPEEESLTYNLCIYTRTDDGYTTKRGL
jgi:hypothetical protein